VDKPDERRRDELTPERGSRREPARVEPLVPEQESREKYKRDPQVVAAGQSAVQVLASDPQLMDRNAFMDMRLPQKRELLNALFVRIGEQTGQPALRGDIGDIGKQASFLVPRKKETFAKISVDEARHADDFAREIARLTVFTLQENLFKSDAKYAESREGIEVRQALSVSGNRGDVRNYLTTVQTSRIGGDARRAIQAGKLIKAPGPPEREVKKQADPTRQKSTDDHILDTVNALFSDSRITDKKIWDSMKYKTSDKWQLCKSLSEKIAILQDRDPLPVKFDQRKTALYGKSGQRVAVINFKDTEDRLRLITSLGTLNVRHLQELALEKPGRYSELVSNATIKDRDGKVTDFGMLNYSDAQWDKRRRESVGIDRIEIPTLLTHMLSRDIGSAYAELTRREERTQQQHLQQQEEARRKARAGES